MSNISSIVVLRDVRVIPTHHLQQAATSIADSVQFYFDRNAGRYGFVGVELDGIPTHEVDRELFARIFPE